jgi:hypothetical protein
MLNQLKGATMKIGLVSACKFRPASGIVYANACKQAV